MAVLRVMVGGREFRRELGSRFVIGRDLGCDLHVDDPKISRLHCLIERKGEEYVAVDLDSHNGTMISGWPLTRQTLKHGDVLDMGVASLQFLVEASRQTAAQAGRLVREEGTSHVTSVATLEAPEPAAVPRSAPARRQASLWEHAMRSSGNSVERSRKRRRVKPEALRKQLLEIKGPTALTQETVRIVRASGSMPWYYTTIPLKVGVPASVGLLALIYVLANGLPSFNFPSTRQEPPKSAPHSSPYNHD